MATKNYVNDGTASVTAGAKTVTFADVSLALMKPGDQFMQKGASGIIDTLDLDAGTAQLVDNWGGTTTAAQAYTVMTIPVGAELANSTRTIMQYLNGPILSIALMSGDDAPAAGDTLVWDDITGGWLNSTPANSLLLILTTDNDFLQRKSGAVVRRTPSQVLTDLLSGNSTGTGNVVLSASPTLTGTASTANLSLSGSLAMANDNIISAKDSGGTSRQAFVGRSTTNATIIDGGTGGTLLRSSNGTVQNLALDTNAGTAFGPAGPITATTNTAEGAYIKPGFSWFAHNDSGYFQRPNGSNGSFLTFLKGSTSVGTISVSGSTTAYNTSSDLRLKENIQDAADCGAIIDALRVRAWDWKADGSHEAYGFIAQEEYQVFPRGVTPGDDDADTIFAQWMRDDSSLVPLLVKELQSLRRRVSAIEAA